jgi:CheY-like chemotaxis protein
MLDSGDPGAESSSSLLRQLAHELRDALSPLASSADLARLRDFDPDASRQLAERVERGLHRALAILDAFVLAEQCEHGALRPALGDITLEEIVQTARDALAEPQRARFRFARSGAGTVVQADSARTSQVLTAVLQHAAAMAPADGRVEVQIGGTAAQPQICIRSASGPANPPRQEWFGVWRGSEARMPWRTARCLMRLQRGDLELVTSERGDWQLVMSFTVRGLEADEPGRALSQTQRAEPARTSATGGASGESILVVDDSREVRRAYREALLALGYRVIEAADAEQALAVLEQATPDVALIDIHLPRMNGYRLAQAIRARTGAAIHLVMLSGMALDAVTRGLAREAGFDDCLDKMAGPLALREQLTKRNSLGNDEA